MRETFYSPARRFLLQTIDTLWVEHLEAMEYLRSSVNLRAYGQRDPLVEYKKEGLKLFQGMEETYELHVVQILFNVLSGSTQAPQESGVIHKAAQAITTANATGKKKEYARNDRVVITNGVEEQEMKYKKAEPLLASGQWQIKV